MRYCSVEVVISCIWYGVLKTCTVYKDINLEEWHFTFHHQHNFSSPFLRNSNDKCQPIYKLFSTQHTCKSNHSTYLHTQGTPNQLSLSSCRNHQNWPPKKPPKSIETSRFRIHRTTSLKTRSLTQFNVASIRSKTTCKLVLLACSVFCVIVCWCFFVWMVQCRSVTSFSMWGSPDISRHDLSEPLSGFGCSRRILL